MTTKIPDDFPPVPDGYVYAGMGKAVPGGIPCLFCHENDAEWLYGPSCCQNEHQHYAVPADSDLGRKILSDADPGTAEYAQKCYSREGLREFVSRIWPELQVVPKTSQQPDLIIPKEIANAIGAESRGAVVHATQEYCYRFELENGSIKGWLIEGDQE